MPVLYMPGTANCIAMLVNKSEIHTTDKMVTDQGQITLSEVTLYLKQPLQLWYGTEFLFMFV
jgi:hypothetical protein